MCCDSRNFQSNTCCRYILQLLAARRREYRLIQQVNYLLKENDRLQESTGRKALTPRTEKHVGAPVCFPIGERGAVMVALARKKCPQTPGAPNVQHDPSTSRQTSIAPQTSRIPKLKTVRVCLVRLEGHLKPIQSKHPAK